MELTARQEEALVDALREAQEVYGVERINREGISISFRPEVRPNRGCTIDYFYANGEFVVEGSIDVYGRSHLVVGEVEWIHNGYNEDCDCTPCKESRESPE